MKTISMYRIGALVTAIVAGSPFVASASGTEGGSATPPMAVSIGSDAPKAAVRTVLGTVSDHLCRRPWDAAATETEALAALEAKTHAMGANGLVGVTFERTRADMKAPCWQRLTVRGTAVVADQLAGR